MARIYFKLAVIEPVQLTLLTQHVSSRDLKFKHEASLVLPIRQSDTATFKNPLTPRSEAIPPPIDFFSLPPNLSAKFEQVISSLSPQLSKIHTKLDPVSRALLLLKELRLRARNLLTTYAQQEQYVNRDTVSDHTQTCRA